MSRKKTLDNAKKEKNDEFYTRLEDIEKELKYYTKHFKNKIIYCNCDTEESNFYKYFYTNFDKFKLNKLIATHYNNNGQSYKIEVCEENNELKVIKTPLKTNGDFRSPECIEMLKECDIVVTNPPFSLFREFIDLLVEYDKKFVIIGNMNALTYKNVFPLIKEDRLWLGYTSPKEFVIPEHYKNMNGVYMKDNKLYKKVGISWFTNLEIDKRNEDLILYRKYYGNEYKYPKYDNYNAINVDKVVDIPCDYYGEMGVPITFFTKYNPNQFEIIGQMANTKIDDFNFGYPYINNKRKYARIIIKRKQ